MPALQVSGIDTLTRGVGRSGGAGSGTAGVSHCRRIGGGFTHGRKISKADPKTYGDLVKTLAFALSFGFHANWGNTPEFRGILEARGN